MRAAAITRLQGPPGLLYSAPPGSRAAARESAPRPEPVDTVHHEPAPPTRSLAKTAMFVGLGLASLAGPAWAAPAVCSAPPPPVASATRTVETQAPARFEPAAAAADTTCTKKPAETEPQGGGFKSISDNPIGKPNEGDRIEFHLVNDSFKDPFGVFGDRNKKPGSEDGDDDGWTAEVRLDYARTRGWRQDVTSARFHMITERGAWDPDPAYRGLRSDILELTHQVNRRQPLGEDGRTSLTYGVGGGLQFVGPLGGRQLQETVHGIVGGRIGTQEGLQYRYTTDDVHVSPMLTGGVKLLRALDEDGRWAVKSEFDASLPLWGEGLGAARLGVGVETRPFERLKVDAGVHMAATYTYGDALDFIDAPGIRPGAHVEFEYKATEHIRPFFRVDVGGVRDEPVYRIGITIPIGGGDRPWLDTPWK